ncbi:MAG: redox-regulated ATPase YchF [Anaerolineae bacterium]|nr:redox-regulated ATPase YchF [Thermoflexales bacterium]MDW8408833.1 redox-regulated ATPase YchF [Anaerolineae bacterium]
MQIGIIGLPLSGKTTIFNALTRAGRPTGVGGATKLEVFTAAVNVPDPRVDALSRLFKPRKTIYAQVRYSDISGSEREISAQGFSGQLLNTLATMDALALVLRAFQDEAVPHPDGSVDPARDLNKLQSEFILTDLVTVERRLERIEEGIRKGARDRDLLQRELPLFQQMKAALEAERPLRELDFTEDQIRSLRGYGLITLKPTLIVINEGEASWPQTIAPPGKRADVVTMKGKIEAELAELPPAEAAAFLADFGIDEPGLVKAIRASYKLLGLQSFFTVGEDEVRAWTVRVGATALECAGAVHTDIMKGFIRAETVSYDDLIRLGSLAAAREKGRLRLEGKEYVAQDGDIMHFRHSG